MSKPIPATLETLRSLPSVLEAYFRTIPTDRLDRKRNAEAWTLREHLYHLATLQNMLLGRMKLLRDDPKPVVVPYFPQNETALADKFPSVDAAFAEFHARRAEQMQLLDSVPDAVWSKDAVHPEYEAYNLGLVVHHLVFHEYWHFYRIEELWLTRDEFLT